MLKYVSPLLFLYILSLPSFGQVNKCQTWPLIEAEVLECNCGEELRNLVITIPEGFKLMSVCLVNYNSSPPRLIDLKNEKVSLDKAINGYLPEGSAHLKGNFLIKGTVRVEESPSSIFDFYPDKSLSQVNTAFGTLLSEFNFSNPNDESLFKIDENLIDKGCSVASATIQAEGLRVQIGGKEEGAYPIGTKVINISKYKPCKS